MKTTPSRNAFARMTAERYEPDTDLVCAVCGYGIFHGDPVAWDENNEICHAECVEKEEQNE